MISYHVYLIIVLLNFQSLKSYEVYRVSFYTLKIKYRELFLPKLYTFCFGSQLRTIGSYPSLLESEVSV